MSKAKLKHGFFPEMVRSAVAKSAEISRCGKYRWALTRCWNPKLPGACWIMLNPSTADGDEDDATIRRVTGFCKRWGFGGFTVVNLFAFRSTDPKALETADDPVGTMAPCDCINDWKIMKAVNDCDGETVVAWGTGGVLWNRGKVVLKMLKGERVDPLCLGVTANGQPKHPLRLPCSAAPFRWSERNRKR